MRRGEKTYYIFHLLSFILFHNLWCVSFYYNYYYYYHFYPFTNHHHLYYHHLLYILYRKLTVDTWNFTFPYEYSFAEVFSDDLLSLVKWVKLVHKYKPRPFTAASPLPADVVIKVSMVCLG